MLKKLGVIDYAPEMCILGSTIIDTEKNERKTINFDKVDAEYGRIHYMVSHAIIFDNGMMCIMTSHVDRGAFVTFNATAYNDAAGVWDNMVIKSNEYYDISKYSELYIMSKNQSAGILHLIDIVAPIDGMEVVISPISIGI